MSGWMISHVYMANSKPMRKSLKNQGGQILRLSSEPHTYMHVYPHTHMPLHIPEHTSTHTKARVLINLGGNGHSFIWNCCFLNSVLKLNERTTTASVWGYCSVSHSRPQIIPSEGCWVCTGREHSAQVIQSPLSKPTSIRGFEDFCIVEFFNGVCVTNETLSEMYF